MSTPGPWFVGEMLQPRAPAIIGDGDSVVAILPGDWNGCSYIKQDARLIAAAPQLLAALTAYERWNYEVQSARVNGESVYSFAELTGMREEAGALARAAIAKATQP